MAKSNDKYIKLRNNHSLKASNVAGDNTIDIVKVNTTDRVEFPSFPLTPQSAPVANYEVTNKLYVDTATIPLGSASGFENRVDSSLSYTLGTRTFTVSGTFSFWNSGKRISKTSVTETVIHGTSLGLYLIYYNSSGTLSVSAVNAVPDRSTQTMVAYVYYNPTAATTLWTGPSATVFEERHGIIMDIDTHSELHNTLGTYVVGSGFALSGTYTTATGSGGLIDVSYGVDSGIIADEDIKLSLLALSDNAGVGNQYPVYYKIGAVDEWRWYVNNLPLLFDGNNDIYYNLVNTGTWSLSPITANNTYMNMYLCAVNVVSGIDNNLRFVWLMGQTTYTTLATAQAESILSLNLNGLPFREIAALKQITMRHGTGYSTASGKARIEGVQNIIGTKLSISINSSSPTIHNNLSGRSDPNSHPSTAISVDATAFTGNIVSDTDTNVQLCFTNIALYGEDNRNKSILTSLGTSDTLYPTQNAVKTYVDNAVSGIVYFNAGESMTGNTTYFVRLAIDGETVGRVYKADSDASTSNKYWTIGVVKSASLVNIGDLVAVQVGKSHIIGSNNTAFSSSDIGQPVYLISGGGFSTTTPDTVGQAVMRVGIVQTTTSMWIEEKQLHGVIDSLG